MYTDGDGQFSFDDLPRLLALLPHFDIVAGYRIERQDALFRKLSAKAWTTLIGLLFGLRVRDIDCAFKVFPRRLFKEIELRSTGALIDAEVLVKADRLGYRIGQVGVHHYPRTAGQQTGAQITVIFRAFRELASLCSEITILRGSRRSG